MMHFKSISLAISLFFINFFILSNDKIDLVIYNNDNKHINFEVEISQTPIERSKGLMFRKSLPQNQGMLFIFPNENIIKMWMKNTFIPLDMIFLSEKKIIVDFKKNLKVLSKDIIQSNVKSKYVLEINSGLINKYDIKIGNRVSFDE